MQKNMGFVVNLKAAALAVVLQLVCEKLWTQALAKFATKEQASNFASQNTCKAVINELT